MYFKTNARFNKDKREDLVKNYEQQIQDWNDVDFALYEYFYKKFWIEIENEGPEFQKDLNETCNYKDVSERYAYKGIFSP